MEGTGGYDCPETFSLGKLRFVGERSWPLCQAHNLAEALFWNICLACQRNSAYKLLREGDSPLAAGKAFLRKHGPNESYAAGPNVEIFESELQEAR